MQLVTSEVNADYYTHHPGIVSLFMLIITYIQAMALHIHTQGRFNNHTVYSFYRIMVMSTSVVGVMSGTRTHISGISVCYYYTM